MFSRKKIAAVSGLVGGLAASCLGLTAAHAAADPGTCTRDLLGNLSCTQRIKGEVPEGGSLPHQDTCKQQQPVRVPAVLGNGSELYGPTVTCNPSTVGVSPTQPTMGVAPTQPTMGVAPLRADEPGWAGDAAMRPMGRILPVEAP